MDQGKFRWTDWQKGLPNWLQPIEVEPHKHFYKVAHSLFYTVQLSCACGSMIFVDRQSLRGHMMPQLNYAVDIRGVVWL